MPSVADEYERLRSETSLVYRLILVMLGAVTEDCQFSDSATFAAAIDACDTIMMTEGNWSARRCRDVSRHLAMIVAGELAVRMGVDAATDYMESQVELVLDPTAFLVVLKASSSLSPHQRVLVGRGFR